MIKNIYRLTNISGPPRSYIELSNICNAKCIFCNYKLIKNTKKQFALMSNEIFNTSLNFVIRFGYKLISFTPTTGEIFLNDDWDNYVKHTLMNRKIRNIYFYSNGINLNKSNISKLLSLPNKNKIMFIGFSVGGLESNSYNALFGVDKFKLVVDNINNFCKALIDKNETIKVKCLIRVPRNYDASINYANSLFNKFNYKHIIISILDSFNKIKGLKKSNLLKYRPSYNKYKPCNSLNFIRFASNGDIWLCGCVNSELHDDHSLKIGTIYDNFNELVLRKNEIIKDWDINNVIPSACLHCPISNSDAINYSINP